MEILQQAFGSAVGAFMIPWMFASIVLLPLTGIILFARKVQQKKMEALLKEFDS